MSAAEQDGAAAGNAAAGGGAAGGGAAATPSGDDHALWHDFHDKFLSYGGPPIPLLRKDMMGATGDLL